MAEPLKWADVSEAFDEDDSLHDIYVLETTAEDWDRFLAALPTWGYPCSFLLDGEKQDIPRAFQAAIKLRSDHGVLLIVVVGGAEIHAHFFDDMRIELTLGPRDFRERPARLDELCKLMELIAHEVRKPIHMNPENHPERALLSYDPRTDKWSINAQNIDRYIYRNWGGL